MNDFFYDSYQLILIFFLPGIFLGIVYDIFRILRIGRTSDLSVGGAFYEKIRPRKPLFAPVSRFLSAHPLKAADWVLVFIEDILFWLIAAITEILLIFHTNGGEIRIYCLIASVVGFFLYHQTLGKLITFFAKQIIFLLRCLIYWTLYAIIYPVKLIANFIFRLAIWLYEKTIHRYIVLKREKKQQAYSEKIKRDTLISAGCGFAVYGKKEFVYEGENEYFC